MNYISSKQAAQLWGISPRRVVKLAAEGRIEGAVLMDNRWLIPDSASKPTSKPKEPKQAPDDVSKRYVFPFLLACVHSEHQIEQFTPEEKKLYRLCMLFETGDFSSARTAAEELLSAHNPYVRLGALYHLPLICMYLLDFEATEKYAVLFRTACCNAEEHKAELTLLLREFDGEIVSITEFSKEMDFSDLSSFPDDHLPFVSALKLVTDLVKYQTDGISPEIVSHKLLCRQAEANGYFFSAMMMHSYFSIYYAIIQDCEQEYLHAKQALEIALEHGTVFTLASLIGVNPETAAAIFSDYPPEMSQRFLELAKLNTRSRNAYSEYHGNRPCSSLLTDEELLLISCCLKNYSIEQMAEKFSLSQSGVKKRLSSLYGKLCVKGKREMTQKFVHSFLNLEKDR